MKTLLETLQENSQSILTDWKQALRVATQRKDLLSETDLESQAEEILKAIIKAPEGAKVSDFGSPVWRSVKDLVATLSASRATMGFSPSETALFVLSIKPAIFGVIRTTWGGDPDHLFSEITVADGFIDKLSLHSMESYISGRDRVIARQQEDMLELSTPVVTLWDGIVALPLIGTLDSARTQVVMETLLQAIVDTNSRVAIIDITGVPTVDTLVAQHLLKTITAARLMGAECILSGIRPQIAQTIVHLGIELQQIATKAKLADAFRMALEQTGRKVTRIDKPQTDKSRYQADKFVKADL